jgi:formylglycine-generating enzyme required for sulfatase activity
MIEIEMVKVPDASFAIGKYPVTQEQYEAVIGTNPSHFQGNPQNPVEKVGLDDAQVFCQKLSKMIGKNYRIPTKAEWKYACRAGTATDYYFGDDENQLGDYAWYGGNSQKITHPVGLKLPNDWGLYDMHGNVWEWCEDEECAMRGGSWGNCFDSCRSEFYYDLCCCDLRSYDLGFRVVCDK